MDTAEKGDEWHGYGSDIEVGGHAALPRSDNSAAENFDIVNDPAPRELILER